MPFIQFKLVGPVLAALVVLIAAMASLPYFAVARIDDEARQREETLVARNIALWIQDVEFSLTSWTIWDEAIARIDNTFDREWIDRNIGASLIGTSRTRFSAIVDGNNRMIYARVDDAYKDAAFFARGAQAVVEDADALVLEVRLREEEAPKGGIPAPIATSRIEVLGDEAVLLSASLFQPDFGTAKPVGARAPVLVTAMPISGSLPQFFGERFLLEDPQISLLADVQSGRGHANIATGPRGMTQALSWRPQTPAADAFFTTLPLTVTVCLLLLVGGLFTLRVSRATARGLVAREREMRHAATHDFLTGLANRSLLQDQFQALAQKGPLVVACADLDGFKAINDTHGHGMGDELLKVVASRLRAGTRTDDRLFRLGGDEFAILMPGISADEAQNVCHRLSQAIAEPMALPVGNVLIGASFGIRQVMDAQTSCDAALTSADAALYRAKATGRGSVVVSSEIELPRADAA